MKIELLVICWFILIKLLIVDRRFTLMFLYMLQLPHHIYISAAFLHIHFYLSTAFVLFLQLNTFIMPLRYSSDYLNTVHTKIYTFLITCYWFNKTETRFNRLEINFLFKFIFIIDIDYTLITHKIFINYNNFVFFKIAFQNRNVIYFYSCI